MGCHRLRLCICMFTGCISLFANLCLRGKYVGRQLLADPSSKSGACSNSSAIMSILSTMFGPGGVPVHHSGGSAQIARLIPSLATAGTALHQILFLTLSRETRAQTGLANWQDETLL